MKVYSTTSILDFGYFDSHPIRNVYKGDFQYNLEILSVGFKRSLFQANMDYLCPFVRIEQIEKQYLTFEVPESISVGVPQLDISIEASSYRHLHHVDMKYQGITITEALEEYPVLLMLGHPNLIEYYMKQIEGFCMSNDLIEYMKSTKYISAIKFSARIRNGKILYHPEPIFSSYCFDNDALRENSRRLASINNNSR